MCACTSCYILAQEGAAAGRRRLDANVRKTVEIKGGKQEAGGIL